MSGAGGSRAGGEGRDMLGEKQGPPNGVGPLVFTETSRGRQIEKQRRQKSSARGVQITRPRPVPSTTDNPQHRKIIGRTQ
ncbi:hypothetical protein PoB_006919000 [Plakobranchus ocellatus]|uniref:Uncharacterized protein n=1 Tax=Plakobranchus ocellatus TaxID=259542 RepID=A0AAV4DF08_9GAST|nr:hypothetical protein PoB_006919000 [Plakobranchus ocellatus]